MHRKRLKAATTCKATMSFYPLEHLLPHACGDDFYTKMTNINRVKYLLRIDTWYGFLNSQRRGWDRGPGGIAFRQFALPGLLKRYRQDIRGRNNGPCCNPPSHRIQEWFRRPGRLESLTKPAHSTIQDKSCPCIWLPQMYKHSDGPSQGLPVQKRRQGLMILSSLVKKFNTIIYHDVDLWDVCLQAFRFSMSLMIDGVDDEPSLCEGNACELKKPPRVLPVTMAYHDCAAEFFVERFPWASALCDSSRVCGEEFCVCDAMFGVKLLRCEIPKDVFWWCLGDGMRHDGN